MCLKDIKCFDLCLNILIESNPQHRYRWINFESLKCIIRMTYQWIQRPSAFSSIEQWIKLINFRSFYSRLSITMNNNYLNNSNFIKHQFEHINCSSSSSLFSDTNRFVSLFLDYRSTYVSFVRLETNIYLQFSSLNSPSSTKISRDRINFVVVVLFRN